jgi:outer membrane protein assembly factor BamB
MDRCSAMQKVSMQSLASSFFRRLSWRVAGLACLSAMIFAVTGPSALAQQDENGERLDAFAPLDYSRRSKLERAEELLRAENYDDSLPLFASLLVNDAEDYFLDPDGGESLKQRIHKSLSALPNRGLETWEEFYGAAAKRLLDEGLKAGDMAQIAEVVRRYPYTGTADAALMLLGRRAFDQGEPLAAAHYYEQVKRSPGASRHEPALSLNLALAWLRSGNSAQAADAIFDLRQPSGGNVAVLGKTVALPSQRDDVPHWLATHLGAQQHLVPQPDGWATFRGSRSRNLLGSGSSPLSRRRWRAAAYVDPAEEAEFLRLDRENVSQGRASIPTAAPVATSYVDAEGRAADVVLVRLLRHLAAVDFATGRVLWQVETASPDATTHTSGDEIDDAPPSAAERLAADDGLALLVQRMWQDAPYGQLTTDGVRVYSIDGLGLTREAAYSDDVGFAIGRRLGEDEETLVNRLCARDLAKQGKLLWDVGGAESRGEPRLAGAFFLGPPLAIENTLYAIAEIKRELRLVALDAATGKLEWQQQLVPAQRSVSLDAQRRRYGATPTMADGVLICPTSAGAIAAVDVASRSLRWGVYYAKQPPGQITPWGGVQTYYDRGDDARRQRWSDCAVLIDNGRVLVAPTDGAEGCVLYCHDLMTGKKLWDRTFARRENLYVAGVRDNRALIVGSDRMVALAMNDGSVAWTSDEFGLSASGERCLPAGRGFAGESHYYLPMSSGELISLTLANGKFGERHDLGRTPLGNLICYRGELVSYGVAGLEALWQTDSLTRRVDAALAKNENDAWALARRGELLLDASNFDGAIDAFRRAIAAAKDESHRRHTSLLLATALLDKLQSDFAANRRYVDEVEQLVGTSRLRDRFERVAAAGFRATGDVPAAFARYLKIIDSPADWDEMIEPESNRRVRRSAWVRAQLAALVGSAAPSEHEAIDVAVQKRVSDAVADGRISMLRQTVAYFGTHPASASARVALASRLVERSEVLAAEQIALGLIENKDEAVAASALAVLADIYIRTNQFALATTHARRLDSEFRDVNLIAAADSKGAKEKTTGKIAAASIQAQLALRAGPSAMSLGSEQSAAWPTGHIKVEFGERTGQNQPRETQYEVAVAGPRSLAVGDGQLILERNAHRLLVRDALGGERLQVSMRSRPLIEEREIDPYVCAARERGHLLILSAGDRIVAMSGLASSSPTGSDPQSPVAWEQPLASASDEEDDPSYRYMNRRRRSVERGQITKRWGEVEYRAVDANANVQGVLGPITESGICYQRGRQLTCVDPATGKLVWNVDNVPLGCEFFGDDEYLFAAPHDSLDGALVFRMTDGESLGKKQIPSEMSRMTTLGRKILVWGQHDGKLKIGLLDAWTGERSWNREIAEGTVARVLRDKVAVFEPTGKFAYLDIASGKPIFEQQLESEVDASGQPRLVSLHVTASPEQMFVIANRAKMPDHSKDNRLRSVTRQAPLVTGRVYALDPRTGSKQWPVPAEVEEQGFVTTQPVGLPLLVFMRHVSKGEDRDTRTPHTTHVYCLDKRTGCAVTHVDATTGYTFSRLDVDAASAFGCQWAANPAQGTITCQLPAQRITFLYTNQPIPPDAPAQLADTDPDGAAANQARAIGAFFKDIGRAQSESGARRDSIFDRDDEDNVEDE